MFIIEQDRYSKHTETSLETDDTDESDFIMSFSLTKDSFFPTTATSMPDLATTPTKVTKGRESSSTGSLTAALKNVTIASPYKAPAAKKSTFIEFCLDISFPFVIYKFIRDQLPICAVKFFVLMMCPDNFSPSVSPCGMFLALETQCPDTVGDIYLIEDENEENIEFNQNTGEATAYQEVTKTMVEYQKKSGRDKGKMIGRPQVVKLPFQCEERIHDYNNNTFDSEDDELEKNLGSKQFYSCYTVELLGVDRPKKEVATPQIKVRKRRGKAKQP